MTDIEAIRTVIDFGISQIEKIYRTTIPEKNKKSYYLRACWLLAQYNQIGGQFKPANIIDNIKTLKEWLPELKKANV